MRMTQSTIVDAINLKKYKYKDMNDVNDGNAGNDGNDGNAGDAGESTGTVTAKSRKRTRDSELELDALGSGLNGTSSSGVAASLPLRKVKHKRKSSVVLDNEEEKESVSSRDDDDDDDSVFDAAVSSASGSSDSSDGASKSARKKNTGTVLAKGKTTIATSITMTNTKTVTTTTKTNKSSTYADPSKYAHLKELTDIIEPNLVGIFVGFNPGIATATAGHAYAHPSNRFWKLLHASGITDRLCRPVHDRHLPRLYQMGNTNIVGRPSKDIGELAEGEMSAGTPALEAKVRKFKPESVCIVGKAIWEGIWRHRYGKNIKREEFRYGWQDERHNMGIGGDGGSDDNDEDDDVGKRKENTPWKGARVFVATSTSGLSTIPTYPQKVEIWKDYGDWINERRSARAKEKEATSENHKT